MYGNCLCFHFGLNRNSKAMQLPPTTQGDNGYLKKKHPKEKSEADVREILRASSTTIMMIVNSIGTENHRALPLWKITSIVRWAVRTPRDAVKSHSSGDNTNNRSNKCASVEYNEKLFFPLIFSRKFCCTFRKKIEKVYIEPNFWPDYTRSEA